MLNPLSTSLNPLSSDSELSGFKIRNTLTFYLGGTQWSPRLLLVTHINACKHSDWMKK